MKNQKIQNKILVGTGVMSALLASICCIVPVLTVILGISGFATFFSFLKPWKPLFVAISVMILIYIWYRVYTNSKIHCECNSFWETKKGATILTLFVLLSLNFPYYSPLFFGANPISHSLIAKEQKQKTYTLEIKGMTCTGCEEAIKAKVKQLPGILEIRANYKTGKGLVRFNTNQIHIEKIIEAIESLGYKVSQYEEI